MAFDAGAIVVNLKLSSDNFNKAIKESGNTIAAMEQRAQRLENLLKKSKLGSDRFRALSTELKKTQDNLKGVIGNRNSGIIGVNDAVMALGGAFASIGLISVGKNVLKVSGTFERYNAVLKNTLGTQEAATKAMSMIEELAAKTPFTVNELTESYVKYVNRGIKPTAEELTKLGDIAASQGKSFDQLTEAILDATSGEFERLKEFGIRASKAGDQVSFSFKGLNQTVANTPEAIQAALLAFGDLEGVAGGMAAISGTLEGKFSNLDDATMSLQKTIGDSLAPTMKMLTNIAIETISFIVKFAKENPALIKSIVLLVAAFASLVAVMVGANSVKVAMQALMTLAPRLGVTMATALGPIGAIVTGLVVTLALLSDRIDRMNKRAQESNVTFAELGKTLAPAKFKAASDAINKLGKSTELSRSEVEKFRSSLAEAGLGADRLFVKLKGDRYKIQAENVAALRAELEKLNRTPEKNNLSSGGSGINVEKIKKEMADLFEASKKGAGEVAESIQTANHPLREFVKSMATLSGKSSKEVTALDKEFAELASTIGGLADQIAQNFVQGLQNNIENIKRRIQVFDIFAQLTMAKLQKQQEKEMADAESRLQAETQMIKDEEAARLAAFEEAQQARINIIKQRQLDEQALRDEELQAELARLEAEKAAFIEQERIKFEQRQLELLDKTETQAQERLVKETNEQDWLAFVEQVNNDFLQRQFETSQQFKNQETVANDEYKMQIAQTEKEVTKNMEAEKAASDARIKAQEQKQADELNAIKKRQEEERTQTEKKAAGIRWLMEIGNLEATKRLQLAQATIQLATGIMSAAATAASLGPFGIPYFAAMSGLLYGAYAMSRATISSQFVLPPAELLMEDGGLLGGSRHSNGGTRIEAERGELFIDRERTARLFETMDNGGMGATIQIMPGAIVVHGNMDESMVEMLAEKIGRQIDRRAF
jgi:hypothetical protein